MSRDHIQLIKTNKILVLFFVLCLFRSATSHAQSSLSLLDPSGEVTFPFDYVQGFIVVDIVLQKIMPLKFILDTGAENTILLKKEYTNILQIPYHKKISLLGSDMATSIEAYVCNGVYLQLVNSQRVRHNIIVLEKDNLFLEEYLGEKIDGILGAEFFKGLILKIDYVRRIITITNPAVFNPSKLKKFEAFDIDIIENKPYLNCITEVSFGKPTKTKLLLDTGAGLTALFHNNTDSLLSLPSVVIKGSLGKGLGGDIEGFSGKIHRLSFGNIEFTNLISSFQSLEDIQLHPKKVIRNGIIGNLILERFEVIFDLLKSKMYLKPSKNYKKDFEFDKSGLTIFAYGENLKNYYVKFVLENSPAYDADIRSGDIILKLGFWSYKWFSLNQINKKFIGKTGKKVKLKIKRGNEVLTKKIILRDLF
ncbi:MAG: hypothetical protein IPO92_13730 [Saprospiraceae bacterium]|nr:hypothetical protein [Saprospiraceae bacterium]